MSTDSVASVINGAVVDMGLLEKDTLATDQYSTVYSRDSGGMRGERHLMLAVLRDALECYQAYALARDARGRIAFAEAAEWIESGDREWPFSYENICDVFDLDPADVRRRLSKMRRHKPKVARRPRIVSLSERRLLAERGLTIIPSSHHRVLTR